MPLRGPDRDPGVRCSLQVERYGIHSGENVLGEPGTASHSVGMNLVFIREKSPCPSGGSRSSTHAADHKDRPYDIEGRHQLPPHDHLATAPCHPDQAMGRFPQ